MTLWCGCHVEKCGLVAIVCFLAALHTGGEDEEDEVATV